MKKQRMLYASPFWPKKSGISEYSSSLVQALKEYYEITLLTDKYSIEDESMRSFPAIQYQKGAVYSEFDVIIYNIGNQPDYHGYMVDAMKDNPGFVILHDFSLYYLSVGIAQKQGRVFEEIYELSGINGIQFVKDSLKKNKESNLLMHKRIADRLPLNKKIIDLARGIFVHSQFAKNKILGVNNRARVCCLHLAMPQLSSKNNNTNEFAEEQWGIPKDAFVIVAAGFIAPTKQNLITCKAIDHYNRQHEEKVYYLMVGEGDYVDDYLNQYSKKTGFIPNDVYAQAFMRADAIFNLRYPTNGETSATMIQAMQLGKVCVTTDIGWFGELPDDAVIKVQPDVTVEELSELIGKIRTGEYAAKADRAVAFVEEYCAPEKVAHSIFEFVNVDHIEN